MNAKYVGSRTVVTLALLQGLSACMQSRVEESREMPTKIAKGEGVVILAKPQIEGAGAEDGFMDCVSNSLRDTTIAVQRNDEFVDSMFPWFEPGTAPAEAGSRGHTALPPGSQ